MRILLFICLIFLTSEIPSKLSSVWISVPNTHISRFVNTILVARARFEKRHTFYIPTVFPLNLHDSSTESCELPRTLKNASLKMWNSPEFISILILCDHKTLYKKKCNNYVRLWLGTMITIQKEPTECWRINQKIWPVVDRDLLHPSRFLSERG